MLMVAGVQRRRIASLLSIRHIALMPLHRLAPTRAEWLRAKRANGKLVDLFCGRSLARANHSRALVVAHFSNLVDEWSNRREKSAKLSAFPKTFQMTFDRIPLNA